MVFREYIKSCQLLFYFTYCIRFNNFLSKRRCRHVFPQHGISPWLEACTTNSRVHIYLNLGNLKTSSRRSAYIRSLNLFGYPKQRTASIGQDVCYSHFAVSTVCISTQSLSLLACIHLKPYLSSISTSSTIYPAQTPFIQQYTDPLRHQKCPT